MGAEIEKCLICFVVEIAKTMAFVDLAIIENTSPDCASILAIPHRSSQRNSTVSVDVRCEGLAVVVHDSDGNITPIYSTIIQAADGKYVRHTIERGHDSKLVITRFGETEIKYLTVIGQCRNVSVVNVWPIAF